MQPSSSPYGTHACPPQNLPSGQSESTRHGLPPRCPPPHEPNAHASQARATASPARDVTSRPPSGRVEDRELGLGRTIQEGKRQVTPSFSIARKTAHATPTL